MVFEFKGSLAILSGILGIEEAETLYNWLLQEKEKLVDMSECEHIHTACLQLLMVFKPKFKALPERGDLRIWLEPLKEEP